MAGHRRREETAERAGDPHQCEEPLTQLAECRFRALTLNDVARNLRRARHCRIVAYRRDGQRDRNLRAIVRQTHGLEMRHALAAPYTLEQVVLLALTIRLDDQADRLAQHFSGRVTKDPCS